MTATTASSSPPWRGCVYADARDLARSPRHVPAAGRMSTRTTPRAAMGIETSTGILGAGHAVMLARAGRSGSSPGRRKQGRVARVS